MNKHKQNRYETAMAIRSIQAIYYAWFVLIALLIGSMGAHASGLEGGTERYRFEPGDQVIYASQLSTCPVGEFLNEWQIVRGGYECARFQDQIWIRPLTHGTTLFMKLPQPLPSEFSLSFTAYGFKDGRPALRFVLHPKDVLPELEKGNYYAAGNTMLIGGWLEFGGLARFGAKDHPRGNLANRWVFQQRIAAEKPYRIQIQVRRNQVRFFIDGKRIGHQPFRPKAAPEVISLYFRRTVSAAESFAEAPVLIRDFRIATYSQGELTPQAEKDLIEALQAEETAEGLKITLSEAILFDFGKWSLKKQATETLEKLAQLAKIRQGRIRVEGHTDNVGTEAFNRVLSELRAHVVALALANLGVAPKRLQPIGFGEARPIVPNDSEANRARNRRVEVIFVKP